MSAWLHSSKPDSTALLWRCQRNRLSPEDHLDVDQVASVYFSARGLSPLRPTSISLTDTSTTLPLPSFIWGRPRNPACKEVEESACQRITARRYINTSPPRLSIRPHKRNRTAQRRRRIQYLHHTTAYQPHQRIRTSRPEAQYHLTGMSAA